MNPAPTVLLGIVEPWDVGGRAALTQAADTLGGCPLLVSGAYLGSADVHHRVSAQGVASTRLRIAGQTVDVDGLAGVLVRSEQVLPGRLRGAASCDLEYGSAELRALVASILLSAGARLVNRCTGTSLSGPGWSPTRWLVEARRAGLPVRPIDLSAGVPEPVVATTEILAVGGELVVPPGLEPHPGFLRLAAAAGCGLLGVAVGAVVTPGASSAWAVVGATAVPTLLTAGHIDAAARHLCSVAGRRHGEACR